MSNNHEPISLMRISFMLVAITVGVFFMGSIRDAFAQSVTIQTAISNAVQTIRQVFVTSDGTASGTQYVGLNYDSIGGIYIQKGALVDKSVTSGDLDDGAVNSRNIATGAIQGRNIGSGAIGTGQLGSGVQFALSGGGCASGSFLQQINQDGTVVCATGTDVNWTRVGTDIFNSNTGDVGIGTGAPAAKLHLYSGNLIMETPIGGKRRMEILFDSTYGYMPTIISEFFDNTDCGGWCMNGGFLGIGSYLILNKSRGLLASTNTLNISAGTGISTTVLSLSKTGVVTVPGTLKINGSIDSNVIIKNSTNTFLRVQDNIFDGVEMGNSTLVGPYFGAVAGGDLYLQPNGGNVGLDAVPNASYKLDVNGDVRATSFTPPSDKRLKTNIQPISNGLDLVLQLQGVSFDRKTNNSLQRKLPNGKQYGFIAQDVEKVIPELVKQGSDGYYSMDYDKVSAFLVEAIKQQQQEIQELKMEIKQLKAQK